MEAVLNEDVLLASRGDTPAFARLVARCQSLVCAISLAIVRDVAASEEVAQEVFLAAWLGLPKLRNPQSFLPWLRQLTRNQANEFLRKHWRHRTTPRLDALPEPKDPSATVVDQALAAERELVLNQALGELPDESREVITLFYREGASVAQVAQLLGLKEDAVKKRLSRAREKLREDVELRLVDTLAITTPGAAFGAAVIAQLALVPSAQAAGLALAAAKAAKAHGPLELGWILVKGLGLGTGVAFLGLAVGVGAQLELAIDAEERRQLKWFGALQMLLLCATSLAHALPWPGVPRWIHVTAPTTVLVVGLTLSVYVWLPRIAARRIAAERARDPVAYAILVRRRRYRGWVFSALGVLGAATGIYFALFAH